MKDKIYYCNITGQVLCVMASLVNVKETSFDEDYEVYTCLNERVKGTIGLLELKHGEYLKLYKDNTRVMVDLETKELIFSYDELPQEPIEPTEIEIMQNEIKELKEELTQIQTSIASLTSLIVTTLEEK